MVLKKKWGRYPLHFFSMPLFDINYLFKLLVLGGK
jgi:hypothetical protein